MMWAEVRQHYPHQWLIVEAIQAHTDSGERILDQIAVVDTFPDSRSAMERYQELHQQSPEREFYVVHTDRETLDIVERRWLGIRGAA